MPVNLRSFRRKVKFHRTALKRFLSRVAKLPPRRIAGLVDDADRQVWKEVDCLSCANCCKTMSPTYTPADIKRIAGFLKMKPDDFKKKWLRKDRGGDWLNKTEPCQFLDLKTNYCSIYEVRPADCAGFPHHSKKKFADYVHVFQQNVEYCPATYRFVELMQSRMEKEAAEKKQ
ncbi:MAG: hypothetical protein RL732_1397 [Bacteroidota bacterium]|jgi:Fe-S-cluster containining protein